VFTTMRRKRRSTKLKNELGQSVDHFKRAASLAAQETSSTVGPKFYAAKDRMQPAAVKAKDAASTGWDSAVATVTPLLVAATDNVRSASDSVRQTGKQSAKATKKSAKANKKAAQKNAKQLEKRANKTLGRQQTGRKTSALIGLALIGGAIGAGAAYVVRKRRTAQWDEYDPSEPIASTTTTTSVAGAEDAAFEPTDQTGYTTPAGTVFISDPTIDNEIDQTSSALHSPQVARMASGKGEN